MSSRRSASDSSLGAPELEARILELVRKSSSPLRIDDLDLLGSVVIGAQTESIRDAAFDLLASGSLVLQKDYSLRVREQER